jgi:hypothetical protein
MGHGSNDQAQQLCPVQRPEEGQHQIVLGKAQAGAQSGSLGCADGRQGDIGANWDAGDAVATPGQPTAQFTLPEACRNGDAGAS